MNTIATILGQEIIQNDDLTFSFIGGMNVDADGAYHAYNSKNTGLDDIRNAKDSNGGWCGIVTQNGQPVIQGFTDPAPGYYVSQTSLTIPGHDATDPHHYVNSETVPFVVVPGILAKKCKGIVLGCIVRVLNTQTGLNIAGVCADTGPSNQLGEVSIALAKLHGINANPRNGGTEQKIFKYTFYPNVQAPGYTLKKIG